MSGRKDYAQCIEYLLYFLKNTQAANHFINQIEQTIKLLQTNPESFPFCDNPRLAKRKIRKIHLQKMNYKIFYQIVNRNVRIVAIIHDLQDYNNAIK